MMVEPSYSQEQMGPASQHSYACWQGSLNHQPVRSYGTFSTLFSGLNFEVLEHKQGKSLTALEFMGLGRLANEKARMLSMGQRKRLQLARVIVMDKPIWLLDEPSVGLDDEGVKLLEQMIANHRSQGGIVIVATRLPIEIGHAMFLRLPPRFPKRITLVDMLPH
ncbi:ABC transporter I family member 1 [Tanacetum coccineum]